jgi:hypothetical protein
MERLTITERKRIIDFAKSGRSLYFISDKMGLGKTTVYYHTRKVMGRKNIPIKINTDSNEKIGEFLGLFAGDGSYFYDNKNHKHVIRIFIGRHEENLKNYYVELMKSIFNKQPALYTQKSVYVIHMASKELISFIKKRLTWEDGFKTKTIRLSNDVANLPTDFSKGFLKGLIDSDGYVRKGRNEIYFGSISKNLINNFTDCLKRFGFNYSVYRQKPNETGNIFYKVRLTGDDVVSFCKFIKPIKSLNIKPS